MSATSHRTFLVRLADWSYRRRRCVVVLWIGLFFLKMIGIGMAAAVFMDATLLRMVLVPSTMELLGEMVDADSVLEH